MTLAIAITAANHRPGIAAVGAWTPTRDREPSCLPIPLRRMRPLPAHHVDPEIDRHGRYRKITGPPRDIGKSGGPRRVVQDRGASQTCRLERVAGCGIIAPRRTNSAHHHRPWRATSVQNWHAKILRFCAAKSKTMLGMGLVTPAFPSVSGAPRARDPSNREAQPALRRSATPHVDRDE